MEPTTGQVALALLLTTIAGLSTGIGALLSIFTDKSNTKLLSGALGLSAGVMVYVSFMELMPQAIESLQQAYAGTTAQAIALAVFFGGVALIALIDRFVPEDENPHEIHSMQELKQPGNHHLKRTGLMLGLAIGIHNFPEGMASFVAALDGMDVALPIILAIAIHNIPEGIAVSVPIYQATGNRKHAFWYSFASGLAEPVGALVGASVLLPFWTPQVNAYCLAAVAGIMVYISFDELLPGAESYGHHHWALTGVLVGMVVMAATLLFV